MTNLSGDWCTAEHNVEQEREEGERSSTTEENRTEQTLSKQKANGTE